jgi:hypothetical protein
MAQSWDGNQWWNTRYVDDDGDPGNVRSRGGCTKLHRCVSLDICQISDTLWLSWYFVPLSSKCEKIMRETVVMDMLNQKNRKTAKHAEFDGLRIQAARSAPHRRPPSPGL